MFTVKPLFTLIIRCFTAKTPNNTDNTNKHKEDLQTCCWTLIEMRKAPVINGGSCDWPQMWYIGCKFAWLNHMNVSQLSSIFRDCGSCTWLPSSVQYKVLSWDEGTFLDSGLSFCKLIIIPYRTWPNYYEMEQAHGRLGVAFINPNYIHYIYIINLQYTDVQRLVALIMTRKDTNA